MKHSPKRRVAVLLSAIVGALFAVSAPAQAQSWPQRPVKILSGFPPGGQTDIVARTVAQALTTALASPVIVETKLGGNGIVSLDLASKAPPDGYTLVVGNAGLISIEHSVNPDLPYKPLKDFTPVIVVGGGPIVLVTSAKLPVRSVAELIAYGKSKPGALNYAGVGGATVPRLVSEQFKQSSKLDWATVSYKGSGPRVADLISGQVDFTFDNLASSIEYVRGGQLRALAVSKKTALLPDVPTLKEVGLDVDDAVAWHGLLAPAGTPPPIVERLNAEIAKSLQNPEVVKKLRDIGIDVIGGSSADFASFIRSESARWNKVITTAGVKFD
ncbi:tripartite tricarboxylate transporter substrate binding protein BugE [soil metagenome]